MRLSEPQRRGLGLIAAGAWRAAKRVTRIALRKRGLVAVSCYPADSPNTLRRIKSYYPTEKGWAYLDGYDQGLRDAANNPVNKETLK